MEMKEKEVLEGDSAPLQHGSPVAGQKTSALSKKEWSTPWDQFWSIHHMKKQVKKAKQSSSNPGVRFFKLSEVLCGSFVCFLCLLILGALPIAMIVIGSIYLHNCPGQRFIPIWLIVFGCFSVFQTFINSGKRCFCFADCDDEDCDENEEGKDKKKSKYANRGGGCCETLISLFLFAWLITGSVWVFGYYNEFQDQECLDGGVACMCHSVPYLFSFVSIILIWVIGAIALTICGIGMCVYALVAGLSYMNEKCEAEGECA